VYAKRNLEIFEGILKRAKELHETNKKNFDMGLIEKVDLIASEANVSTREAEILIIRNAYKQAQEDLKLVMNMTDNVILIPAEKLSYEEIKVQLPDCLKKAFENRRDYKAMARDIEIKGIDLNIKKNMKWPEIDLVGSIAMNAVTPDARRSINKSLSPHYTNYYAGIEVNVPFENRAAQSDYLKAKYEKESSIIQFKQTERSIITEVGNAYRGTVAYESSIAYISKAVDLQAEKLTEEEKRFQYGRSNTKRLIDYQSDLLRAEIEEALSLKNYQQAQVGLDRSMNIILSKYEELL